VTREELTAYIQQKFGDRVTLLDTGRYDPLFQVAPEFLLEFAQAVKTDDQLKLDYLCNLGGIDTTEHFEAHYSIASLPLRLRLDFKVVLPHDNPEIESVQSVWTAANWFEREMWELYGINVKNHGNLTRFLLPDDWNQGHPMRKDWDAPDFIRMPEA